MHVSRVPFKEYRHTKVKISLEITLIHEVTLFIFLLFLLQISPISDITAALAYMEFLTAFCGMKEQSHEFQLEQSHGT